MRDEHPGSIVFEFDEPYSTRLEDLRYRCDVKMDQIARPSMEFPANLFGGMLATIAIKGYFTLRESMVMTYAAITHGMHKV